MSQTFTKKEKQGYSKALRVGEAPAHREIRPWKAKVKR